VALARALAIEPPLLLLDEPMSNLDQALRVRTRGEIRALVRELGITALFVTHDQEEAFDLSDRIAVMEAGRLRQLGTPRELYERPADRFVAGFVGRVNELPVQVEGDALVLPGGVRWPRPAGRNPSPKVGPADGAVRSPPTHGDALLLLRPESLRFTEAATDGELSPLPGRVVDRRFGGAVTTWRVEVDGVPDDLEVTAPSDDPEAARHAAVGERVGLVPLRPGAGFLFARPEGSGSPPGNRSPSVG
jgi:ABC-type Fe3+/spermidine/putrescine transport system ATPase subunit